MNRRTAIGLLSWVALGRRAQAAGLQRHFYITSDEGSVASLRRHATWMDLVSPQWYEVDAAGKLVSLVDAELAAWARSAKVRLMPLILNHEFRPEIAHLVLTDSKIQSELIAALGQAGVRLRLRGYQLDFENVPREDRDAFTSFVKTLGRSLRDKGLQLSIAAPAPFFTVPGPANPDPVNERALAFDYKALAAGTEFITVMTYDEHTSFDNPGPVSGRPWVEACMKRLLAEVPAKKLMLGVPLYYRRFRAKGVIEGTYEEAVALAGAHAANITHDAIQGESTFTFDDDGVSNIVWLQDKESTRERLRLAKRLRLRGFSAWRLGHEDPAAWPYLSGRS